MSKLPRRPALAMGLGMAAGLQRPALAQDPFAGSLQRPSLAPDPVYGHPVPGRDNSVYPNRPVQLLSDWVPGDTIDSAARAVAERLTHRLGQSFAVGNRGGASGGPVAAEAVAREGPRDGHLLLLATAQNLAVNVALRRDLPVDPARDLVPIAQIATVPFVLVVHADLPVRSMTELLARARQESGRLNAGTPGIGSLQHLALELLKTRARGLDIAHVPFRSGVELLRELLGGRLQIGIDSLGSLGPSIETGRLRALATFHGERLLGHPELPTVAETPGLDGVEAIGWIGLAGPSTMPGYAMAQVEAATGWAVGETDLSAHMAARGLLTRFNGADAFRTLVARDREKWARVAREAGVRLH